MYKFILFSILFFTSICAKAQIQRKPMAVNFQTDSLERSAPQSQSNQKNSKQLFKEMDLTKEQRGKLKEVRQQAKAKRLEIENNTDLSPKERKEQLKIVRKEADASIQAVLSAEQWKQFQEDRKSL